jgi:DNA polymerase-3 subunit epsilon
VCKASSEPGGPKRCSADARSALQRSSAEVTAYEHLLGTTQGHAIDAGHGLGLDDWRPQGPGSAEDLNRAYRSDVKISPVYAATQFARAVLEPGRAVIVDTETVSMGGPVCEIAVIRADTGQVLLNTLVNPRAPIVPAAQAVHGISEDEVSAPGIPTWANVYGMFEQVTQDCVILAYNSDYDRGVIDSDCTRYNIPSAHVSTHRLRWGDVMAPRSHYAQSRRWLKNDGGHRALGDVLQTRNHLLEMARGDALAAVQPRPPMTQEHFHALITRPSSPHIREAG